MRRDLACQQVPCNIFVSVVLALHIHKIHDQFRKFMWVMTRES